MRTNSVVTPRPNAGALRGLCFAAFALALGAPARADETLAVTSPTLVAAAAGLHTDREAGAPKPDAPRTPRSRDARHFPAFGPLSIAGSTYYPYRFEGHVHTEHSRDARHRTVDILKAAEQLGLDALVITDHGASAARYDFADYHGPLVPFVGREIGGVYGHAVMWNVADDTFHIPARTSLQTRCEFAHTHDGLLVFAHPGWWIDGNDQDPMRWMTPEAVRRGGSAGDIDAIELWNGVYRTPLPKLVAAWVELLEAGVYVPIVGNSDFHRFDTHQLGNAHNIALCDQPDVSHCLWSAVREGRVIVTDGPAAVFSVNDRLPGSVVTTDGAALRVAVEALAPDGGTLQVYLGRTVVQTLALPAGVRTSAEWQVTSPAHDSFVRIDIARPHPRPAQTAISLLSNPVLVDVGPQRASWR